MKARFFGIAIIVAALGFSNAYAQVDFLGTSLKVANSKGELIFARSNTGQELKISYTASGSYKSVISTTLSGEVKSWVFNYDQANRIVSILTPNYDLVYPNTSLLFSEAQNSAAVEVLKITLNSSSKVTSLDESPIERHMPGSGEDPFADTCIHGGWGLENGEPHWYTAEEIGGTPCSDDGGGSGGGSGGGLTGGHGNGGAGEPVGGGGATSPDYIAYMTRVNRIHNYDVETVVCNNASLISDQMRKAYITSYTVPTHTPRPVANGSVNEAIHPNPLATVNLPGLGSYSFHTVGGNVTTTFIDNGRVGKNVTSPLHVLHSGAVFRTFIERNGQLIMQTTGGGSNYTGYLAQLNEDIGPTIFAAFDELLKSDMKRFESGC